MPRILIERLTVDADAIDLNGHVNNQEYVRWMQDIATAHSQAQGWNLARYHRAGCLWVIRSHHIDYKRPAFNGDEIKVATWIEGMDSHTSPRRYRFVRACDEKTLVDAETLWVFCDLASGRPCSIPDTVRAAFPIVTDPKEIAAVIASG